MQKNILVISVKYIHFKCISNIKCTISRTSHKASLNKLKKIEIISSIFSSFNGVKLEINYKRRKHRKKTNRGKLKSMPLNNQWVIREIREEIKIYLKNNENRSTTVQNLGGCRKSSPKRDIYSHLKKQETPQINNLTQHLKELEKGKSPKLVKEKITNIREEINETLKSNTFCG